MCVKTRIVDGVVVSWDFNETIQNFIHCMSIYQRRAVMALLYRRGPMTHDNIMTELKLPIPIPPNNDEYSDPVTRLDICGAIVFRTDQCYELTTKYKMMIESLGRLS